MVNTVTSGADDGAIGTLRYAILNGDPDPITGVVEIEIVSGLIIGIDNQITFDRNVNIVGLGNTDANMVVINVNTDALLFNAGNEPFKISNVRITGANYVSANSLINIYNCPEVVFNNCQFVDNNFNTYLIYSSLTSVTFENCSFLNNIGSQQDGGIIQIRSGIGSGNKSIAASFINCLFNNNQTATMGGVVNVTAFGTDTTSSIEISNCRFVSVTTNGNNFIEIMLSNGVVGNVSITDTIFDDIISQDCIYCPLFDINTQGKYTIKGQ